MWFPSNPWPVWGRLFSVEFAGRYEAEGFEIRLRGELREDRWVLMGDLRPIEGVWTVECGEEMAVLDGQGRFRLVVPELPRDLLLVGPVEMLAIELGTD